MNFEQYAHKIIKKYSKILLLDRVTITLKNKEVSQDAIMECSVNYPYLDAEIYYDKKALDIWKKKKTDIIQVIIHELCHTITEPLYIKAIQRYTTGDGINEERERLTDYISQIVVKNKL